MEDKIEFIVSPEGTRSMTSYLFESNINLQYEVNKLKICRKNLAYALIERDLKYCLHNPMNELVSGKYLSEKTEKILRQNYFSGDEVRNMIMMIKTMWDSDHYEAK